MVSLGLFCGFSGLAVLLEFIMGLKIKIKIKIKIKKKEKEKEKMIVMGIWSQNRQRKRLLGFWLANLLWSPRECLRDWNHRVLFPARFIIANIQGGSLESQRFWFKQTRS